MFNNQNGSDESQEQQNLDFLDKITIAGFIAQIKNMAEDQEQNEWIHGVIVTLAKEVQKLHKENDILIEKVDKILKILEEDNNAIN